MCFTLATIHVPWVVKTAPAGVRALESLQIPFGLLDEMRKTSSYITQARPLFTHFESDNGSVYKMNRPWEGDDHDERTYLKPPQIASQQTHRLYDGFGLSCMGGESESSSAFVTVGGIRLPK